MPQCPTDPHHVTVVKGSMQTQMQMQMQMQLTRGNIQKIADAACRLHAALLQLHLPFGMLPLTTVTW